MSNSKKILVIVVAIFTVVLGVRAGNAAWQRYEAKARAERMREVAEKNAEQRRKDVADMPRLKPF